MFRALICPSSGVRDYVVELPHWLFRSWFAVSWNLGADRLGWYPGCRLKSRQPGYQEYFLGAKGGRCLELTALQHSCADCLEVWEPQPTGTLGACPGL